MKSLKKQHKSASEEERQPLVELRNILRGKLKVIRRAEYHRRRRRERAKKRTSFIANPFRFAKDLLGDKRSGRLECSSEEIDSYLSNIMRDPDREKDLDNNTSLIEPEAPSTEFDLREPSWKEVKEVVGAARSA